MAEPFLGEIKLVPYDFPPRGWAFCSGQLLAINQNQALFALLGTTYGGNGQTTFALPDLRGRGATHRGQGPGLSNYPQGQAGGQESVTLSVGQLPAHNHAVAVSSSLGNHSDPTGEHLGAAPLGLGYTYGATPNATMPAGTGNTGGNTPHENRHPFLVLNYCIALQGIFPSQ